MPLIQTRQVRRGGGLDLKIICHNLDGKPNKQEAETTRRAILPQIPVKATTPTLTASSLTPAGDESRGQTGRLRAPSCSLLSDWPGEMKGIHPETHFFDERIKVKDGVLTRPPDLRGGAPRECRRRCSGHESGPIKAFEEIKGLLAPEEGEV